MFNPYAQQQQQQFYPGQRVDRRPNKLAPSEPQATLYIRNLNEKLKVPVLKQGLVAVFSAFGTIVDIKVKRNLKHRGQAFVSFESKETASQAMQKAQGFPLFEKPMDIQFALEPAFAVSALDGDEKLEGHKRKRMANLGSGELKAKKMKGSADEASAPNQILFVQNLPAGTTQAALSTLFSKFSGFKEVRMVPGKAEIGNGRDLSIAFVEFDTEMESATAKSSLHGFRMSADNEIKLTFAKK